MLPALLILLTAGAVMAEDTVTYEPGCTAKIYVIGRFEKDQKENDKLWPIKALPDAPSETVRLTGGPNVETNPSDKTNNNGHPNYLVRSKLGLLNDVNYYAVELEGWVQAKTDGVYTISLQSDDPVEIFMEGKSIVRSEFIANWDSEIANELGTAQGSVKLTASKWYHVSIIARQRWFRFETYYSQIRNTNRGAHLKVWMATPGGQAAIIPLCLPSKVAGQQ